MPRMRRSAPSPASSSSSPLFSGNTLEVASMLLSVAAIGLSAALDHLLQELAGEGVTQLRSVFLLAAIAAFGLFTVAAPITHMIAVARHRQFSYFQPFQGGGVFVTISVVAWALYGVSIVLGAGFLYLCALGEIPFAGLLTYAALSGFGAQLLVLLSLRYFDSSSDVAATVAGDELRWNVVACFSLVILAIVPMTWFVLLQVFQHICKSQGCDDPTQQLAMIFQPLMNPTRTGFAIGAVAIFLAAPITHGVAGQRLYTAPSPKKRKKKRAPRRNARPDSDAISEDESDVDLSSTGLRKRRGTKSGGGSSSAAAAASASYPEDTLEYHWFQPFKGGQKFVLLQMLAWTSYTLGLIFVLYSAYLSINAAQPFHHDLTLATLGGAGGFVAQVLVLLSLPYFDNAAVSDDDAMSTLPMASSQEMWGRHMVGDWFTALSALFMMASTPLLVVYFWLSCTHYECALSAPLLQLYNAGWSGMAQWSYADWTANFPEFTLAGLYVFLAWMAWQIFLCLCLPGPMARGQLTPADNLLEYRVNGFRAWVVTHVCFYIFSYELGWFSPAVVADYWGPLLCWATAFGLSLTLFAYFKACYFPTHPEDCKFSGSFLYDLFMGVELNPRFTKYFDFKLFFNGRPGIIGWTIINWSFAAAQARDHGYVTNSMIALNVLHAIYVVDFFWNESWYLRTIDIAHDHFGFYLSYGDMVWLPYMYTLQSHYLLRNPVDLPLLGHIGVYALGFAGYWIFRSVNHQKDFFRANKGKCKIWGKPATFIKADFKQADGSTRTSYLLTSGWWGLSRHFNYVGDLMMSLSFCLCCGFKHLLPYFYIIYMTILLVHRVYRDDQRCRGKYKHYWKKYCKQVPYKILPYVF